MAAESNIRKNEPTETVPCYSWDSRVVGPRNISSGTAPNMRIRNLGPGSTMAASCMKQYGTASSKYVPSPFYSKTCVSGVSSAAKSITRSKTVRPQTKVSGPHSDFVGGHSIVPSNGCVNYRSNGKMQTENERARVREKSFRNEEFEAMREINCGPRSRSGGANAMSRAKDVLTFSVRRDKYNLQDLKTDYESAKFYVIKSFNEDNIHRCVKYEVWSSTPIGNKKLDATYHDAVVKANETGKQCPVFLFFSVNHSGQFVGVAEMVGQVDFNKDMDFWQLNKWSGFFPVKWHIIKDIPHSQLRHIVIKGNDNRDVTYTRDTQEIELKEGLEMLKIFKSYSSKTCMLDDFDFYENRESSLVAERNSKSALRLTNMYHNDNFPEKFRVGERRMHQEPRRGVGIYDSELTSSVINRTRNLSLGSCSP